MNNDIMTDNLPPQNIEAEQAVLGAIFLNTDALADAMEYVEADDLSKSTSNFIPSNGKFEQ